MAPLQVLITTVFCIFQMCSALVTPAALPATSNAQTQITHPLDGLDTRHEDKVRATEAVGGPHGTPFTDVAFATGPHHRRISSITLFGCGTQHITKFLFAWRDNSLLKDAKVESFHGTNVKGESEQTLNLAKDEYIKEVQLRTWKAKYLLSKRTRVGWIKMITSKGHEIECGAKSDDDPAFYWKYDDYALLYLSGLEGDELDSLSGHFILATDYF